MKIPIIILLFIPLLSFAHELNGVHEDEVMGLYETSSWKDNHERYDLYGYSVEDIEIN